MASQDSRDGQQAIAQLTDLLETTWRIRLKENGRTFTGKFMMVDRQVGLSCPAQRHILPNAQLCLFRATSSWTRRPRRRPPASEETSDSSWSLGSPSNLHKSIGIRYTCDWRPHSIAVNETRILVILSRSHTSPRQPSLESPYNRCRPLS